MDGDVGAAVRPLPESGRKNLAIQALAGSETVSDLANQHGVAACTILPGRTSSGPKRSGVVSCATCGLPAARLG